MELHEKVPIFSPGDEGVTWQRQDWLSGWAVGTPSLTYDRKMSKNSI